VGLNVEYVGRTYTAGAGMAPGVPVAPGAGVEPFLVGRQKVREFATAVGDTNPLSHDLDAARAAGYPDLVAPPTFAIILHFAAMDPAFADPGLGLDYSRLVHGTQEFHYRRPIVAGDALIAVATIEQIRARGGHDLLTVRADIEAAGEHVVTTRSVVIIRGIEQDSP